ncbi:hypothetical protein LJ707_12790 [Mucilaginibacter sp. UR6-1]|uniref:hypothetical protein n=1 Tax=Mucilaginibacter sp. UR6-1 TaxID=1435643 RepID=UPI001E4A7290|nr:hypothetical protein [Mucilaginibacter sp. UR6-1]MCC8409806.1 hypothetical protein [Mucilaginibacter sp. UR6-1]
MELAIKNTQTNETESFKIISYNKLSEPQSSYVIFSSSYLGSRGESNPAYDIHKIQFIADCETEFSKDKLLVAFYINDEYQCLDAQIISQLPEFYCPEKGYAQVVDYAAYSEICALTGGMKYPFKEYLEKINAGLILNSLGVVDGRFLNIGEIDGVARSCND